MARLAHAVRLVALLTLCSATADAAPIVAGDPFTVAFHGETCTVCWSGNVANISIEGALTVVPATGRFWDPWFTDFIVQNVPMVIGISGAVNIDCHGIPGCTGDGTYALSFLEPAFNGDGWSAPRGDGSYLWFVDIPRYLVFAAEGSGLQTRIINDNAFNLFQWSEPSGFGSQAPIHWSAVAVPEPFPPAFSLVVLVGLMLLCSFRRSA